MRSSDLSSGVCSSELEQEPESQREVARSHALGRAEVVARGTDGDERAKADVEGASNEILLVVDDHGDPTIRCGLHAVAIGVTPTGAQSSPSLSVNGPAGKLPVNHLVHLF